MQKSRQTYLSLLLLTMLTSCFPFSAVETLLIIGSVPLPYDKEEGKVDLSDYSIGPFSSGEFRDLVSSAFPGDADAPFAEGWAQWTGLKNVKQNRVNQSVAAFTHSEINFLWWNETHERYERLIRLPYTDFHSAELKKSGPSAVIALCHKNTEILIGDKAMIINRETLLGFKKSDVAGDWEKTEQVFLSLNQKIQSSQEIQLHGECMDNLVSSEKTADS
jgi:hypothetical protein